MFKEREDAIRGIMTELGYTAVEKSQYTTWYRRDCGSHVLWLEIYYENGGSWLPSEGYYIHFRFVPPVEPQPATLSVSHRSQYWFMDDWWLGMELSKVREGVAKLVPGIKKRFEDDLRRAYERYGEVSGLTP